MAGGYPSKVFLLLFVVVFWGGGGGVGEFYFMASPSQSRA